MKEMLEDIQNKKDIRGIDIQKVGVKDLEVPLIIQRKFYDNQVVYAKARLNVSLPQNYKGTHMSRFVEVLNDWRQRNLLGMDIKGCLVEICNKLNSKLWLFRNVFRNGSGSGNHHYSQRSYFSNRWYFSKSRYFYIMGSIFSRPNR